MTPFPLDFTIRGVKYALTVLDEGPDVDTDPTLLLFREDEEVAQVTVHLNPEAPCHDRSHITLLEGAVTP